MKILNYGSLNIDHVYPVPHIILPGETLHGGNPADHPGGKGANQAVAIAKAGAEIWMAGKIGEDAGWVLDILTEAGAHTEYMHTYDGPTGHTIIQVTPQGQNSIILFSGGNTQNTREEIDEVLGNFTEGDYLVLQNEINEIPYIIDEAAKKGMKICLNPAPFTDNIKGWPLEKLELLIVNELEGEALAGISGSFDEILDRLTEFYPDVHILLTLGKAGAKYGKGAVRHFQPIIDSPVVDTTAAGDTFFGYFLAGFTKGKSVEQSMYEATYASSVTVSRPGAMGSIPFLSEIEGSFTPLS